MQIQFMFTSIKDQTLLEEVKEEASPFGGDELVKVREDKSKDYITSVMNSVKCNLQGMSYSCCGCRERIAREEYDVQIGNAAFRAAFIVDTNDDGQSSITVEITKDDVEGEEFEQAYCKELEQFKLSVKGLLLKDFGSCIWLVDDQSEKLCAELYHQVFRIENQVRAFANKVLNCHMGYNWLEQPGLEKYRNSVRSMETTFKQIVSDFANINTVMLSMTLETLSEVMLKAAVYKEDTTLSIADISKLFQNLDKHNVSAAKELVQRKREVKLKIWDEVFSQYFDTPDVFQKQLTQFIKSRNHIAHNKLLTFPVYKQMQVELSDFAQTILSAANKFELENPSIEMLDTWQIMQEQEEYEENYWRDRIRGEAGVDIRDESEIYDMFCQSIYSLYEDISDRYHYDPCYTVSDNETPADSGDTIVFTVMSNASEEVLSVQTSITIDDEMDGTSCLDLKAFHNGELVTSAECTYHNGMGHEGGEGLCVADCDSEYHDSELHDFLEEICGYIEEQLNPYVSKMEAMAHAAAKEGGQTPVADFSCEECGKCGISICEALLPIGKCCYCGTENEVGVCEICGTVFDELGGQGSFCNGCVPR